MRHMTLAAALLLLGLNSVALAQSSGDHQAHHSDEKEAPAAKPAASPDGRRGMRHGGMMGGNMPMMDMMRRSGDGIGGIEPIDHVEGRIAFLRAELKITDAQTAAWNAFAEALRANAKALGELRAAMMQDSTQLGLVDRLTQQEKWLSARLEGTRAIRSALVNLVGTFSDEQQKAADELLTPHTGMMPMMSAMRGGRPSMQCER
ncbi:Spy/CpxP family protein refolding chaperone [Bradyrhizobium sp. Ai1a-2]|uniref:Spy/CpxP family protein refolding chaperone n=1 Tax=Bradyrhizobium sp. Ai1a-2 TaxID=196490 RepID=UPI000429199D|nr:Spy/CpxP family protein refolding chaperone [Bradyrhizobium sp. Ai1a-2]